MEDIKSVISLESVEEFWGSVPSFLSFVGLILISLPLYRLYNNMMPPSNLPTKANYYLFKVRQPFELPYTLG